MKAAKTLTCAAARRRLQAYHDGELSIADQIRVTSHLRVCRPCADAVTDLQALTDTLRRGADRRAALTAEEAASLRAAVVSRAKAEHETSFVAQIRAMFDDMHLVYAGCGAAVATMVCLVVMLSMMRFASSERSDSLAAMVAFLATPGSSADAISTDAASHARWTARFQAANEVAQQDAVFALAAVVTRGGRLADLERLRAGGHKAAAEQAKQIEGLLDAVARARLETGQPDAPATSGIVGLITRTTVRPTSNAVRTIDLVLPPASKKRAANLGRLGLRPATA